MICVDERMNYTDEKNILEDTDERQRNAMKNLFPCFS